MRVDEFDFELPAGQIAERPAHPRDGARLLEIEGATLADRQVRDLPALLRAGDLLVVNDTKVIRARLIGRRGNAQIEIMLHKRLLDGAWSAFARPAKKLKPGDFIAFAPGFGANVAVKGDAGEVTVRFNCAPPALPALLAKHGQIPLPPYIKRPMGPTVADRADYQTMFAANEGAVAAPTASLHFTADLLARLAAANIGLAKITLHVGAGTFLPVKAEQAEDHKMHGEWGNVSRETSQAITEARQRGGRIVAVGTTALRLLESAAKEDGTVQPFMGETAIYILPGYRFKAVDLLLTNFHLPRSTLFMLACAFAGTETMKRAYAHAIATGYRFYSYGDACLLHPGKAP